MIFRFLFLLTLVPAIYLAYRRGGDFVTAATVVIGSWAVSFASFEGSDPIWTNALADALCAAFIAILCLEKACLQVGMLFALASMVSIAYGVYIAPKTEYNLLYAHTLSIMGHLQNLALLFGAADDGIRSRILDVLRALGRPVSGLGFHRRHIDTEDRTKL